MIWDIFLGVIVVAVLGGVSLLSISLLPKRAETEESNATGALSEKKQTADGEEKEQKKKALERKGRQSLKRGDFLAAEKYLYQACGLKEADPELLKDLVEALLRLGKLDKAKINLEKLVQSEPKEENLLFLGDLLREIGEAQEKREHIENSIFCYQSILKKRPDSIEALRGSALTYIALGMEQEAVSLYERIFAQDANEREAGLFLLRYYNRQKEEGLEAKKIILEKLSEYFPLDDEVIELSMQIWFSDELFAQVYERYQTLPPQMQEREDILSLVAISSYRLNKFEEAARYFTRLSELDNSNSVYFYNAALNYVGLQDYETARENVQQAIDLDADDARFHFLLAKILLRMDKNEEAQRALQRVLELDPNQSEALQELKRLERA